MVFARSDLILSPFSQPNFRRYTLKHVKKTVAVTDNQPFSIILRMPIQFKHIKPIYVPALIINLFITAFFNMSTWSLSFSFLLFGFGISMLLSELFLIRFTYLFRNLGYSRAKLWFHCWILNCVPAFFILLISMLWKR